MNAKTQKFTNTRFMIQSNFKNYKHLLAYKGENRERSQTLMYILAAGVFPFNSLNVNNCF